MRTLRREQVVLKDRKVMQYLTKNRVAWSLCVTVSLDWFPGLNILRFLPKKIHVYVPHFAIRANAEMLGFYYFLKFSYILCKTGFCGSVFKDSTKHFVEPFWKRKYKPIFMQLFNWMTMNDLNNLKCLRMSDMTFK